MSLFIEESMAKCFICEKNEQQERTYSCKECETKLFYELNPFQRYIKKIFADTRYDDPDPKYARRGLDKSPLPPLTKEEISQREWDREEIRQKEYPSYDDIRRLQ